MANGSIPKFDTSRFSSTPYVRRVQKPWGWEMLWTPRDLPYAGKVLHVNAGHRMSLQVHEDKLESWLLISGRAKVTWENADGEMEECELEHGRGYSCARGRKHRLAGITECDIIEVSTPEVGMTWRLDDDYGRSHESPAQREIDREA